MSVGKVNNIKRMVYISIGVALTVALIYILRFPIFLPFLEYDPGDIPIYFCTFLFGPVTGFVITVIASIIQGITVSSGSGWVGIIMHIFATGAFSLVAGFIYYRKKNIYNLLIASIVGSATVIVTMVFWNLIFTPFFMGVDIGSVISILPLIIAFNLIKVLINVTLSVILYNTTNKYITF